MKPLSSFVIAVAFTLSSATACGGGDSNPTGSADSGVHGGGSEGGTNGGGNGGGTANGGTANGEPQPMPTFSYIYSKIIVTKCNGPLCHSTIAGGNLVMDTAAHAYDHLIDQPAAGAGCGPQDGGALGTDLVRVAPGKPDESLMYAKITNAPCGDPMPVTGMLTDDEIGLIKTWIENGAMND